VLLAVWTKACGKYVAIVTKMMVAQSSKENHRQTIHIRKYVTYVTAAKPKSWQANIALAGGEERLCLLLPDFFN